MRPLREAPGDPFVAFERAAEAAGRARAAVRAALPMDRAAADLGVAGMIAGGALLVRGELPRRRALMNGLGAAFGLEPALVRTTPGMTAEELREVRAARLSAGPPAPHRRPPLAHGLVLVERLAEAAPAVRDLLFHVAAGGDVAGWVRPATLTLLVTQPAAGLDPHEADRMLARIDLRDAAPGAFGRAVGSGDLHAAQVVARTLPVGERVLAAALDVVRRARPGDPEAPVAIAGTATRGPGPRAGQALLRLARARALADGRLTPDLDDIRVLAPAVLAPRMGWRDEAAATTAMGALMETVA